MTLVSVRERGVGPEQLRWIATDPEIFEVFYREHVEAIQRFVARRVGDRERAADLTAEIFLAAIGSAHRYRSGRGTPKAWLYGIARTVVATDWRQVGREQAREERLRASALLDENDVTQIEARIDAAAKLRHLYEAMGRLSEACCPMCSPADGLNPPGIGWLPTPEHEDISASVIYNLRRAYGFR